MATNTSAISNLLASHIHGDVIDRGHPQYDGLRTVDNLCQQRRPTVIVRCADAHDVAETIRVAAAEGLPLAVRAGGHSAAGFGSVDDGVVIDLRQIKHVRVDPKTRIAAIGGGALAGSVDRATHEFGLATTTPTVSTVGVSGFTLGGGLSYLTRKHGLAIDNLVGADVVLADGSQVRAGEDGDQDLLWALAGGGGNFGVVTELRMRLHPVSTVIGGPMLFRLKDTERISRLYRDWMPEQSDDIYAFMALLTVPPVGGPFPDELRMRPVCALVWCNTAPDDRSKAALAIFRAERPVFDGVTRLPYPVLQTVSDASAGAGKYGYLSGLLYGELPDAALAEFEPWGAAMPTPLCTSHLYPLDGAAARVEQAGTAWPWRSASFAQMFAAIAPTAGLESHLADWSTGFRDTLRPYALPGCYANFMMDEGREAAKACYGANGARLSDLKRRYDPDNLFRHNQNISPTQQ
jgi:hypothetical protein